VTSVAGVALLAPALLLVGLVILYPIGAGLVGSLLQSRHLGFGQGVETTFAGLANFNAIFSDPVFWISFKNNLIIFLSVPLRIVLGLLIVQLLYRGIFASRTYQVVIFLPFVVPIASIGIIFIYLLNDSGPLNALLRLAGLDFLTTGWLTDQDVAIWSIMAVVLWTRLGFAVLLFMARLMSVDRQVFQAAFIDGATWRQAFWRVGVPELRHTIEFVALLGFIEAFSWSFSYVFVLGQGAFRTDSWILELFLYDRAFRSVELGAAYAVSVFLFFIACIVAAYRVFRARAEL
jgi:ABC-type sugar transport system permease subunit